MSAISGTTQTYGVGSAGGNREDLEDVIWELDPLDTYCLTNFDRTDAQATFHEWERDTLTGVTVNRQLEGDDGTFTSVVSPTRLGNYCQISRKTFLISGTQEKVAKAGRKSEVKRQLKKQMRELKNDMEYALVRNQTSSAGGATTARSLGSIESCIPSTDNSGNGIRATTSASASTAAFGSNVFTAPTDGTTTGALTESVFKEAIRLAWVDGGNPSTVLVESTQKISISGFSGIATKYNEVKGSSKATIIGSADMYVSEWGNHTVVLHRHVRSSVVLILDPEYWSVAFLRTPFMEELAKTGDGEKRQLLSEFTLVARNPDASAKVAACA
jgi:hypothetical protein